MNNKFCIVVQGPSDYVKEIKEAWKGFDLIFSTWEGEEEKYEPSDIVFFSKIPNKNCGVTHTLHLQRASTLNGLLYAKKMGYGRVLKWRSDHIPTNAKKLVNVFKKNKLNIHSFHKHRKGYITDFFMEGEIDDLIKLFTFAGTNYEYPEEALTEQLFCNGLNKKVNFFVTEIDNTNDILWLKRKTKWSDNLSEPLYMNRFPYKVYHSNRAGVSQLETFEFNVQTPNGIEIIYIKTLV